MVLFFDIDDTLIDSESAHTVAIKKLCLEHSVSLENMEESRRDWLKITNKYLILYFSRQITLEQQRMLRISEFWERNGHKISDTKAQMLYQQYHQYFLNSCDAFSETFSFLENLKNFRLGIISNGTYSDQIFKLKKNNLIHFFEKVIISEKVGYSKPEKEIFTFAAQQVCVAPSDCIYVGDSFETDYTGSTNAGMKGIWLDRKNSKLNSKCEKIKSLVELLRHSFILQK